MLDTLCACLAVCFFILSVVWIVCAIRTSKFFSKFGSFWTVKTWWTWATLRWFTTCKITKKYDIMRDSVRYWSFHLQRNRVPKCDIIKFSFLHYSIFMTIFQQNMMKNPHTPNLTWIGSQWPEIWPHEYLISLIEISVNWPGSKQLWTRPIYTDFNGAD